MSSTHVISEAVKGRNDVGVGLNVDPFGDVLLIWNLPDHELLPKVLMIHHVGCITDHVLDLTHA